MGIMTARSTPDAARAVILDCTSIETARETAAGILRSSIEDLRQRLRDLRVPDGEVEVDCIATGFLEPAGLHPNDELEVHWFHASRVEDPECFRRDGILTKSSVVPKLKARLTELAEGLGRKGRNPFGFSAAAKAMTSDRDEGPNAFLIRTTAVVAPRPHHAYWQVPELVQDMAGGMLGDNFQLLVDRFTACTQPCVVKFRAYGETRYLAYALWYLYLVERGRTDVEAGRIASTCFSGRGAPIPPGDIIDVELLDDDRGRI